MTIDTKDFLNSILASLSRIDYIRPDSIPNIDLYMDQITTFMDTQLSHSKRHGDDKVLTKTMINNYAKNNLLPPPVRKKYSKEHVLTLIFIYYFKNLLSINDIQSILHPLTEKYFASDTEFNLTDIYEEVFSLEREEVKNLMKDITKKFDTSFNDTFKDAPEDDKEFLHTFSFVCMLSFDVFVKKMLIEKIIDQTNAHEAEKKAAEKEAEKQEKAAKNAKNATEKHEKSTKTADKQDASEKEAETTNE